jgi:hypothetical protein
MSYLDIKDIDVLNVIADISGNDTTFTTVAIQNTLGIGTYAPVCPLHITAVSTGHSVVDFNYITNATATPTLAYASVSSMDLSIKTSGVIWSELYIGSSDERIKKNIVDVPDNLALDMVRELPCRYYKYKDPRRGVEKTIGFSAQEVKKVLPMAVLLQTEFIPDVMEIVKGNWVAIGNSYNFTATTLQNVSGKRYRFYMSNDPSGNDEKKKEVVGNEDGTFTFDQEYANVFCYGKEIDDFHTIDKQKIFALHHSAIQELDKKIILLETTVSAQNTLIESQNTLIQSLIAKFDAL